jgi:hypothetical protein
MSKLNERIVYDFELKGQKSIQQKKGPGCSKTFFHGGKSYQLMTINVIHSKHAGKND